MNPTAIEQTQEACVPTWHGQHLERATVLSSSHVATMSAALTGIQAIADLLHDRESQRAAGEATHCPTKNMGLLAAVHSLATLVQMHTAESAEDLPGFVKDAQGLQELRATMFSHDLRHTVQQGQTAAWAMEQQAQHQRNLQPNQPQTHAQQAQAAIKDEARKSSPRPKEPLCTR